MSKGNGLKATIKANIPDKSPYTVRLRATTMDQIDAVMDELQEEGKVISKSELLEHFILAGLKQYQESD